MDWQIGKNIADDSNELAGKRIVHST